MAAVALLTALGLAQPASAAGARPMTVSTWKTVTTDSSWHCNYSLPAGDPNVLFQACTVVSGQYAQVVLVVVNDTLHPITINGTVDNYSRGYTTCGDSQLTNGYRRGCYGQTFYLNCGGDSITGQVLLTVNGTVYDEPAIERSAC